MTVGKSTSVWVFCVQIGRKDQSVLTMGLAGKGLVEFKAKPSAIRAVTECAERLFVLSRTPHPIRCELAEMVRNCVGGFVCHQNGVCAKVRDGSDLFEGVQTDCAYVSGRERFAAHLTQLIR